MRAGTRDKTEGDVVRILLLLLSCLYAELVRVEFNLGLSRFQRRGFALAFGREPLQEPEVRGVFRGYFEAYK